MPSSSSAHHGTTSARIPPLAHAHASRSIPPSDTDTTPHHPVRYHPLHPRAATRAPSHAHALPPDPDVAAQLPPPPPIPAPPLHPSPPARTLSTASHLDREHRTRTALPTIGKVDSKPKTIAATVKSRAHSRLASFGRIRSRGSQQSVERNTSAAELLSSPELPPLRHTPSFTSSHKRSEPSTASYYYSETALSDDKFHDEKSFDEPRPVLCSRHTAEPIRRATRKKRGLHL